jgi:hypothetical protein
MNDFQAHCWGFSAALKAKDFDLPAYDSTTQEQACVQNHQLTNSL